MANQGPFYTLGEEIFNSVSHGVGAALGIAGCVVLVVKAAMNGTAIDVVSSAIFGASLILLYTMSTLYHSFTNPKVKHLFRIFDHCTIYILISGSYTPFALVSLGGLRGWIIFGVLWGLTILCIVLNSISLERFSVFSMIAYIAMGWCALVFIIPISKALGLVGLLLLLLGGVSYTLGLIFFASNKKYMHSIWHLFVLAGSVLHYFCVLFYTIP
ncbi:MAG: hemolysin III family protein [Oscillospiraceae bacterium]